MSLYDLTSLNTLSLHSSASRLVVMDSINQLDEIADSLVSDNSLFVLGGGSNVVLMPRVKSVVLKVETKGINLIEETSGHRLIEVQAGESWHNFVAYCVNRHWGGLENLALIPGTVGAAPVQNIGAYGVELDQVLHSIVAWDFKAQKTLELGVSECQFSYRNSMFKKAGQGRWLILKVRFKLPKIWSPNLKYSDLQNDTALIGLGSAIKPIDVFKSVCNIRKAKLPDPKQAPNAGSFFKNPVVDSSTYKRIVLKFPSVVAYNQPSNAYKLAAAWLIEQCGWKGKRLGPVGMHSKQSLVMVNYEKENANANHVLALANTIKLDVKEKFGVELEQEPVLVA